MKSDEECSSFLSQLSKQSQKQHANVKFAKIFQAFITKNKSHVKDHNLDSARQIAQSLTSILKNAILRKLK